MVLSEPLDIVWLVSLIVDVIARAVVTMRATTGLEGTAALAGLT